MAENTQIFFTPKEIVTALLKQQGIHEGLWSLAVRFGIQAMNVGTGPDDLLPAAIVPVGGIGIQKAEAPNNLTVDAAVVNPRQE